MNLPEFKRKLTTILIADVKGYSRLMEEDEEATVHTLREYKEAIINLIQQHRGRVVDTPGDNLLAEYLSVVEGVQCAVGIQKELKVRNAALPEHRRMEFRIGVNLGDVIEEKDRIFGDGVNIAAGLERFCDPGAICISGTAYDQVKSKLPLEYEYLGKQTLKNMSEPVRVYRVRINGGGLSSIASRWKKHGGDRWSRVPRVLKVILLLGVGAMVVWQYFPSIDKPPPEVPPKKEEAIPLPEKPSPVAPPSTEVAPIVKKPSPSPKKVPIKSPLPTPPFEVASKEKMAFPLPNKPSIAVLPLLNLTSDPRNEFFSNGMTEDIITALAKSPHLFVVSRTSTFAYKGKAVKVKQVSEELGVQFVLEGSVQLEGERVRVTAQLIDALSGYHVWADRYDRPFKNLLSLQDEITVKIMEALHVKMELTDHARVMGRGARNIDAYLKGREAREHVYRMTAEDNHIARKLAEEAIALDPEYARAYAILAGTYMNDVALGTPGSPMEFLGRARDLFLKAISLDETDGKLRADLAYIYGMTREYDKGFPELERALSLDPHSSETLFRVGGFLVFAGKQEEAISYLQRSIRLNPFAPSTYYRTLSRAYRAARRYEEAIGAAKQAVQRNPGDIFSHINLVISYVAANQEEEARSAAAEVLKINPKFSLEEYAKTLTHLGPSQVERMVNSLRKAGLE